MTEGIKQPGDLGPADQILGQSAVEGRHRPIGHNLNSGAARAEGDNRPEHRIGNNPGQQFPAVGPLQHRFDGDPVDTRLRAIFLHRVDHVVVGAAGGLGVTDTETDPAYVGFMGDVR